MTRKTGQYRITSTLGEEVRAFVPYPLPPTDPPLVMDSLTAELLAVAQTELARLAVAGSMVPSTDWFLYGFVRKEAVITSQIEGDAGHTPRRCHFRNYGAKRASGRCPGGLQLRGCPHLCTRTTCKPEGPAAEYPLALRHSPYPDARRSRHEQAAW